MARSKAPTAPAVRSVGTERQRRCLWAKIAGASSPALQAVVSTQDGGAMFRVAGACRARPSCPALPRLTWRLQPAELHARRGHCDCQPGPQTAPAWVLNISPGPEAWEVAQAVSFIVTVDNAALFAVPLAIDAAGTLTFMAAAEGAALVDSRGQGNGGTAFGGQDTSMPNTSRSRSGARLPSGPAETSRSPKVSRSTSCSWPTTPPALPWRLAVLRSTVRAAQLQH